MRPTILHVEDDAAVADVVQMTFERFGFRGTTLHAETVEEAGEPEAIAGSWRAENARRS